MENTIQLKGLMVLYIHIQAMSYNQAQTFLDDYKKKLQEEGFIKKMRIAGYECLFVPNREFTKIELLKF